MFNKTAFKTILNLSDAHRLIIFLLFNNSVLRAFTPDYSLAESPSSRFSCLFVFFFVLFFLSRGRGGFTQATQTSEQFIYLINRSLPTESFKLLSVANLALSNHPQVFFR